MLTAKLNTGEVISLVKRTERKELFQLKKKETFYCPVCSEKMLLKLGEKRIPHFAHVKGSNCTDEYDRESEYHMKGKLFLYEWLLSQGLSPALECYYPSIKQRADIAFEFEGKTYCIEFQCSAISPELFKKRNDGYRKLALHPIWIIGGQHITKKGTLKVPLSSFHYLFVRGNHENQYFLPAYCPQMNEFIRIEHLVPISIRNTYHRYFSRPLEEMTISDLLNPSITSSLQYPYWRKEINQFKRVLMTYSRATQDPFLRTLYTYSLNPYLIPPYVGLPLELNLAIETAPFIWQSYIFLEHLFKKEMGTRLEFQSVYKTILSRVREGQVKIRNLPSINKNLLPFAVQNYLSTLTALGLLEQVKNNVFEIVKPIKIANNMEEWMKEEEEFYQLSFSRINRR